MNKKKALEQLREYIENYSSNYSYRFHKKFIEELTNLILKNAVGNEKDYYSLHIENKIVNIRMLMAFSTDGNPVFLAAFF